MARKPRIDLPGIAQHVVQRGVDRGATFFGAEDYRSYLVALRESALKYGVKVHAYCLMTNHVHLLVTPEERGAVSVAMQSLGRRYVRLINARYRRTGPLWEGRYKACVVDTGDYVLRCYRYIEINPVSAGMVESPGEYSWSSYHSNAAGEPDPILVPHAGYLALADDDAGRSRAYRELFTPRVAEDEAPTIRSALRQELAYGSERFKDQLEAGSQRRVRPGSPGRPRKDPSMGRP